MATGLTDVTDAERSGRAFELAVGAELKQQPGDLTYWRERDNEVDFVYRYRDRLYAIEVKSGRKKSARGLDAFCSRAPGARRVVITPDNFPQFSEDPAGFLGRVSV